MTVRRIGQNCKGVCAWRKAQGLVVKTSTLGIHQVCPACPPLGVLRLPFDPDANASENAARGGAEACIAEAGAGQADFTPPEAGSDA